ncbi:hypothetical protein [Nitrospirillum sp. BR 11828]|uniref:hypothetical protein n=1 Tax=Nitrospirillum sp. BR 11828 TaxID=3104325 RepID=UPI002ACAA756|nr:hypothetical protein [Nitrospirillum sp. BR 11828]MDZ5649526.1 hypothetical protein [Nitrospirillum sp. BR 11828]
MVELPWLQISGAVAGGVVGGFSGFIANTFHERRVRLRAKRNIACALIGEIGALSQHIEENYLSMLRADLQACGEAPSVVHHAFRGDRDYMPVFRALGSTVGYLPTPLPRDLVYWYTSLAAGLERARALHELSGQRDPEAVAFAVRLAKIQDAAFIDLLARSRQLLDSLDRI